MTEILSETTERFLREVIARVPVERIAELRLFQAIRQGGAETGVAVVAAESDDPTPTLRHVIYTARYRHTLKGVERGKWEFALTAEADAPLITVDDVVLGVMRRAGDESEPERMTSDGIRAGLRIKP